MKKILITISIVLCAFIGFAQEEDLGGDVLKNKKGIAILPEAGNIVVGIDAAPIFQYAGNMFNAHTYNSLSDVDFMENQTQIHLAYYLEDDKALRLRFGWDKINSVDRGFVADDAKRYADPLSKAVVEDRRTSAYSLFNIGAGYEIHRTRGRLDGYFGGEAIFTYENTKTEYAYGNPITDLNNTPSTYYGTWDGNRRTLIEDYGNTIGFGLSGIIGVQYFFAPNICVGAEFGWGILLSKSGQTDTRTEFWNGTQVQEEVNLENGTPSSWSYRSGRGDITGNTYETSSSIFVKFHF